MYLALTDGTTTLDFVWNGEDSAYQLAVGGWTPTIAERDRGALASSLYRDVTEELTIHIHGASATECRNRLGALIALLQRARDWYDGDSRACVRLRYLPTDGQAINGDVWSAAIIGGDIERSVSLAPTYHSDQRSYVIRNVRLRLTRRGRWLGPDVIPVPLPVGSGERSTTVVNADGAGRRSTLTFSGADRIFNPMCIEWCLGTFPTFTTPGVNPQYLFVAGDPGDTLYDTLLTVWRPRDGAGATNYTSAASAVGGSTHGNVLRFTPTAANVERISNQLAGIDGDPLLTIGAPTLFVAVVRVNNAGLGVTYRIRVRDQFSGVAGVTQPTNWVSVQPTTNDPLIVPLGVAALQDVPQFGIEASATGDYLEIDNLIALAVRPGCSMIETQSRSESSVVVQSGEVADWPSGLFGVSGPLANGVAVFDWTKPGSNRNQVASGAGNANLNGGTTVRVLLLTTALIGGVTPAWRPHNAGTPWEVNYAAWRRRACLIPE